MTRNANSRSNVTVGTTHISIAAIGTTVLISDARLTVHCWCNR